MSNSKKVADYLGKSIECECGRTHSPDIRAVDISSGALNNLPQLVTGQGFKKAFVVADVNTMKVAGEKVLSLLKGANIEFSSYVFPDAHLVPDEHALGKLFINFDPSCDLIIAVGAGTINDICRYLSHRLGLPYYIVATAPSMDGYASTVAPLIRNNLKTTFECHTPYAIIGDLDIISQAPQEMVAAGYGDVLGKYTCLADWQLSSVINNEYYCDRAAKLTRESLKRTIALSERIGEREPQAIGELMEALVLSGIAMSYVGNSRPASGSEHHVAHFWEMRLLWAGKEQALHGAKVGISTVYILKLYHALLKENLDQTKLSAITAPDGNDWVENIKRVFLEGAEEVILLEKESRKNDPTLHRERIKSIAENWDKIVEILETVPSPQEAVALLETVHAHVDPASVGVEAQWIEDGLLYAKEIRARYTILQLLWDLNLLGTLTNLVTG